MDILEGMDTLAHAHHVHVSLLLSHHVPGSICHTHHYVQEDVVACGAYTWYVVLLQVLEAVVDGTPTTCSHHPHSTPSHTTSSGVVVLVMSTWIP